MLQDMGVGFRFMVKKMASLWNTLVREGYGINSCSDILFASFPTFVTRNDGDVVESDGLAETAGGGGDIMLDTRGSS